MAVDKKYYPLAEAESLLGLKAGTLLLLGVQGTLPIYVLADNWFANIWATPAEEILGEDEGELHVVGYDTDKPIMTSPPNAPTLLNGPVRLTPDSIARFEIQTPAAINAFMLPEAENDDYPHEYGSEYRLIDTANLSLPKNVQISKTQLFIMQADFKKLSEQHLPEGEKPVSETERKSLYKLIFGMAAGRYKYDPSDKKSAAPAAIKFDLNKNGLAMDEETILKWLRKAASASPVSKPDNS